MFIEPLFGRPGENLSGGSLADDLALPHVPENLTRRGHTFMVVGLSRQAPPRDGVWGERYFHLTDPDGHEFCFARRLPRGDPGSG